MNDTVQDAVTNPKTGTVKHGSLFYLLTALGHWIKVFWLLVAVLVTGFTIFGDAVATSINSTPYPELVYVIFGVGAVAVLLFARMMRIFVQERIWFEKLLEKNAGERKQQIDARKHSAALTPLYRLVGSTMNRPVVEREKALANEVDSVEAELMARLALPNLLSGGLVGLGLAGTFIGLLQTLAELSGLFSALGGSQTGDASSMFSGMISQMQGPMEGMGTAFVSSLYGLLGSLVIGLTGLGVKRIGEKLFSEIRLYLSDELYVGTAGVDASAYTSVIHAGISPEQWSEMLKAFKAQNAELREGLEDWMTKLEGQISVLSANTQHLNVQMETHVSSITSFSKEASDRFEGALLLEDRLAKQISKASDNLAISIGGLRGDLRVASSKGTAIFGKLAYVLTLMGGLTGLLAVSFFFVTLPAQRETLSAIPGIIVKVVEQPLASIGTDSSLTSESMDADVDTTDTEALQDDVISEPIALPAQISDPVDDGPEQTEGEGSAPEAAREINPSPDVTPANSMATGSPEYQRTRLLDDISFEQVAEPPSAADQTLQPDSEAQPSELTTGPYRNSTTGTGLNEPTEPSDAGREIEVSPAFEALAPAPLADVSEVPQETLPTQSADPQIGITQGSETEEPAVYLVKERDTLSAISALTGTPLSELLRLNSDLNNPDFVLPGQVLRLTD